MNVPATLRGARHRAGLSQAELAARAGTSQATISAYESGRKTPSVATLERLLAASGARLAVEPRPSPVVEPSPTELSRARGRGAPPAARSPSRGRGSRSSVRS